MSEAAALQREVRSHLEAAQRTLDELVSARGNETADNALALYDELITHIEAAAHKPGLLERVHPDATVRDAAEEATREVDRFATELSLNRAAYEALAAVDVSGCDAVTRHYMEKTLRDYRRAGVDRDEATRAQIRELNEQLTAIGQEFARNIQTDTRSVRVQPRALDGLPEDYVRAHPADDDGLIVITTDYPDYVPFMAYSTDGEARKQLYTEFRNRGYPKNLEVLDRMLAARHTLAGLLDYEHWASYIIEDKMIGSHEKATSFVEHVARIAEGRARAEYEKLLSYKRRNVPAATRVDDWEKEYYEEIVKSEEYAFDSQSVRPYFAYESVRTGVLEVTGELFGVAYRRVDNPEAWAPGVETYDVYENRTRIGRFHLDMHPRPDKYKHAAQFTLANGIEGKQLPEAALVCNFPGGKDGDPGLMEHREVQTFFHEFGHLLHSIFAGRQAWIGVSGISTEWDFVEAPSQMLEEWSRDVRVLQRFARHHEAGEPIPTELVERMRRAGEFAKGVHVRQQTFYAMLSLNLYDRDAKDVDTTALTRELQQKYSMYDYVDGTHFHCSFGHLDAYSAVYYTYMWSLAIAKDLFSTFDRADLMAPEVARHYRRSILEAGGSAPAALLVQRFLGRPHGFDAFEAWLNEE